MTVEGSVRVDLLGGTLDLDPINVVLKDVITLNVATSLKAKVTIESSDDQGLRIISKDYDSESFFAVGDFSQEKLYGDFFGPLSFVAQIFHHLDLYKGIQVTLESGSPAGAGLGGSSSMGVTIYKAICEFKKCSFDKLQAIQEVRSIEARILNAGPAGYQDYYPALFGGVLALKAKIGAVEVEQLFNQNLKEALEKSLTLVYSGQTRLSGINNWEVYKGFFDKKPETINGLQEIGSLSLAAFKAIKEEKYDQLIRLIGEEGELRKKLFPAIQTSEMNSLHDDLLTISSEIKLKVCGAGGGGCFLITHEPQFKEQIIEKVTSHKMFELPFSVEAPL